MNPFDTIIQTRPSPAKKGAKKGTQQAILDYVARLSPGQFVSLTDAAADPSFRGIHFAQIERSAKVLAKRGRLRLRNGDIAPPLPKPPKGYRAPEGKDRLKAWAEVSGGDRWVRQGDKLVRVRDGLFLKAYKGTEAARRFGGGRVSYTGWNRVWLAHSPQGYVLSRNLAPVGSGTIHDALDAVRRAERREPLVR